MRFPRSVTVRRILLWSAVLSLLAAYAVGYAHRHRELLPLLTARVPEAGDLIETGTGPLLLKTGPEAPSESAGYYVISRSGGWGGPLYIAARIDGEGFIRQILILDHNETLSFFYRLEKRGFFQQFQNKHVSAPLLPGRDIDTVTQATVSSHAFTEAIRRGSHRVGREIFAIAIPEEEMPWRVGWKECLPLILFVLAGVAVKKKTRYGRYLIMGAAMVGLGVVLNASLSIAHFGSLLLGFCPRLSDNLFWWLMVGGAVVSILLLKKNLYCHALCPFGNLQEFNFKLSRINLSLPPSLARVFRVLPLLLTWAALMVVFIQRNPASGAFEPFSTLFSLEGLEIQWMVLSAAILGSFFVARFFCRFFCPVGCALDGLLKLRCRTFRRSPAETECTE
jgi:hypothetical protein